MAIDPAVMAELNEGLAQLSRQAGGAAGAMGALKSGGLALGTLIGGPAGGAVGQALADLPGMISGAFSGLKDAAMSVKDAFDSVVSAVKPYVAAFAPSTVMAFDMAIRDTTATIGFALVPVLQSCTQIVRDFGDAILPTMRELEPAIREVSGTLQGVFGGVVTNLGGLFRALAGAALGAIETLRPFGPVFEGIFDTVRAYTAVVQAVFAQFVAIQATLTEGLLGLRAPLASLGDAMKRVAGGALIAAASLMKLFGMDSAIRQMKRAFGEGQDKGASTGMAAAQNAQIMDVSAWSKQVALAMATAQGTGGESKEDQFQNAVRAALEKIDTQDLKSELKAKIEELKTDLVRKLGELPRDIAAAIKGSLPNPLRPPIDPPIPLPRNPWG